MDLDPHLGHQVDHGVDNLEGLDRPQTVHLTSQAVNQVACVWLEAEQLMQELEQVGPGGCSR